MAATTGSAERALEGLRVLELGDFISASYGAKLLADLGADVVKVEPPRGDSVRDHGPFADDEPHPERGGLHLFLNANKRSVTLDSTDTDGRDLLLRLAESADVVIHNIPPATLEERGLTYEAFSAANPQVVMVSVTVFGYDTPYRDWKGYALNATVASGISNRIGDQGRAPLWIPYCAADFQGGVHAAIATLLALQVRRKTGDGQHAWLSVVEVVGSYLGGSAVPGFVFSGQMRGRAGTHMDAFYPWQVTPVADGYFEVITMVDEQWQRFVELTGGGEWADDERLQARWQAWQWAEEFDQHWHPWMREHSKAELVELFAKERIAFQPVNTVEEVVHSDHLRDRDFWRTLDHPEAGEHLTLGPPYRLSRTPWELRRAAPLLGEHSAEVYIGELGLTRADYDGLAARGVVA
ncbi:MAG: CoA transferase [Dehalococcoidia bacterium]|jgi:crotonobetainyl-CoA:carnitine CoA-transferase CaiB-like acyl-CoA transferase|nr:CoA transferase [Dehalococcoidia bacterium]